MNIGEIVKKNLKYKKLTKTWLAEKMSLSYSTLHQKLDNDTFTAEELLRLSVLLNLDLKELSLLEYTEHQYNELQDISIVNPESRLDIRYEDMEKYKNGGIFIENKYANGCHIYIPNSIRKDLIDVAEGSFKFISEKLYENEKLLNLLKKNSDKILFEILEEEVKTAKKSYIVLKYLINCLKGDVENEKTTI